jgi:hypothetical protein
MQDPKVPTYLYRFCTSTDCDSEPPCPGSSQFQLSQRGSVLAIRYYPRHPDLQHQDPDRRLAYHKPSFLWAVLAIRFHQCLPCRYHEEIQAL